MIIEKLMRQADFTDVEKSIADYLLQNGYEVKNMSISDLAKRTYSSPATITRFCRKLDLDGYKKFQILFNSEYDAFATESAVDANYPFSGNDSFEQIARKLAKLNSDTISKTISGFDYNQFRPDCTAHQPVRYGQYLQCGNFRHGGHGFPAKNVAVRPYRKSEPELLLFAGLRFGRNGMYGQSGDFPVRGESGRGGKSPASEEAEGLLRGYHSHAGQHGGPDVPGGNPGGTGGRPLLHGQDRYLRGVQRLSFRIGLPVFLPVQDGLRGK